MGSSHLIERLHCPACRATELETVYSSRFDKPPIRGYLESFYERMRPEDFRLLEGADFTLSLCKCCGLIFQKLIGDSALLESLYESWIDPGRSREAKLNTTLDERLVDLRDILLGLAKIGRPPAGLRVLDFGMGWAEWCGMALGFSCAAYGTEISRTRRAAAEARGVTVLSWEDLPAHRFDYINADQVIEHLPEPLGTLQRLRKCIEDRGLLKVGVPDGRGILRKLAKPDWMAPKESRRSLNAVAPLEHINCFRHRSLVMMARRAGFIPVRIPLRLHYCYNVLGKMPREFLKSVLRPLYRNYVPSTVLFFTPDGNAVTGSPREFHE